MTPNIRYINQSAPFWDWIANFEDSAYEHPWFGGAAGPSHPPRGGPPPHGHPPGPPPHGHHRGGPPPHGGHPHGPPPPFGSWWGPWGRQHNWHGDLAHHGPPPPDAPEEESSSSDEKRDNAEEGNNVADPPEESPQPPREGCPGRRGGRHPRCGGERRGRGFGRHQGHGHGHPYGRWGFPGRGGFGMLSELFQPAAEGDNDWKPEADVFDTESSYVVHVSLPGAKKDDIGVSWDPEKSELSVAGVVHRPGDEEFLKTMALDERKVGAFERKVRLGTRVSPAHVDVDGISAKLENGILVIDVPKLNGEFVEIKKVDIE